MIEAIEEDSERLSDQLSEEIDIYSKSENDESNLSNIQQALINFDEIRNSVLGHHIKETENKTDN